ncbi:hypothetical protein GCM10010222_76460 [Streptomyces tanashiensis]|nr:hypothetical protein GCM10010222_76460 [Streptomyces tanashiensis]GGY26346.1 hypothetical protein GCM10010299_35630 [Streptomyces tanashiensis]
MLGRAARGFGSRRCDARVARGPEAAEVREEEPVGPRRAPGTCPADQASADGGTPGRERRLAALQTRSRSMCRREVRAGERGRDAAGEVSLRPVRPMVSYLFARFSRP